MKLEIIFIDDTWARVKFHGDNDYYLGSLAPSRGDSLPEIIRVAILAGWTIDYPENGNDEEKDTFQLAE